MPGEIILLIKHQQDNVDMRKADSVRSEVLRATCESGSAVDREMPVCD